MCKLDFAAVRSHFLRFLLVGRTHTPHQNSINLSCKYTGVTWRDCFLAKVTSCFLRILLNFWKHLSNRTERNTTSENNNLEYNAR